MRVSPPGGSGADADGEVVDPLRVDAIHKLASREEVDEIVVSTLLPLTHISGPAGPSL